MRFLLWLHVNVTAWSLVLYMWLCGAVRPFDLTDDASLVLFISSMCLNQIINLR